jgi:uncharacterized protein (DUF362 family)
MPHWTRRRFLTTSGAAAVGAALWAAGCGGDQTAEEPPLPERRTASPSPIETQGQSPADQPPPGYAGLAVARGDDPARTTNAALAALGGMGRFVRRGDDVVVKPNICSGAHPPEYAATTHPDVVGTLVALCREAGAGSVRVMDSPFGSPADEAYRVSGIAAATERAGGEVVFMSPARFQRFRIPEGRDITEWDIYRDVLSCDVLIDVPIAKDHGLSRLTLGGKNLLGVVLDPGQLHSNIGQRTADLVSVCRPTLTVVDAVRILVANGPTGGDLGDVERRDTVIASPDIVAADSYAATLFGLGGGDIPYVRAAYDMGLGEMDLERVLIARVTA